MSHSATLLPDGKVLVVGGFGSGLAGSATAELFDPTSGQFAPAAGLNEPRSDHAAVLLADGRILIVGGDTSGVGRTPTAAAELYDPATGIFTPTGAMRVPREPFVAVRLRDGRVLVAGGTTTGKAVTATAEIYDPTTGAFTLTGSLHTARRKHAGFLLPDGRVLVVGGTTGGDDSDVLRDGEIFDPATGQFSPAPGLLEGRYKFSIAVLPDGSALAVGGAGDLAEVYDPASGGFHSVAGASGALRYFPTATLLADSSVLITGGYSGRGSQPTVWRYRLPATRPVAK
jgi:WD40 repeat protein